MPRNKIRILIEVSEGVVQAVYAPEALVEVVLVDHDDANVSMPNIQPQTDFNYMDVKGYDGGIPTDWDPEAWYMNVKVGGI